MQVRHLSVGKQPEDDVLKRDFEDLAQAVKLDVERGVKENRKALFNETRKQFQE